MGTPNEENVLYRSDIIANATNDMSHGSFIYDTATRNAVFASACDKFLPCTTIDRPHFSPARDILSLAHICQPMAALLSHSYSEKFSLPSRSRSQAVMISAAGSDLSSDPSCCPNPSKVLSSLPS